MNALTHAFALDELRVEPLAGLVSGPGGREKLDPKVMDVLVLMAEHSGEVLLRNDLHAQIWPNAIVTDDALNRCFYELRRGLARAGGDERYRALVETMPKRGYRLNAQVRPLPASTVDAARRAFPWVAVGSAVALILIATAVFLWRSSNRAENAAEASLPRSIAVLPFLDMSAGKDHAYFSDGVTEEILNRLSQADNLRVISRTSSFTLRDDNLDVPQIAKRLDVNYVLEGSVRRSGDRVRVTAQLIDADTNSHLWSETYDRSVTDIFAVQDEVARSVAAALQVTLERGTAQAERTSRFAAYDQFLQGQFLYGRRSAGDVEIAVGHFERAVAIDPGYARAWASLAGACSIMADSAGDADAAWRKRQGEAAHKAVELDPQLAVAQARLAQYYRQSGESGSFREHFEKARALDPNDMLVLGFSGSEATYRGDFDQAVDIWRRIVMRDPLSPINRGNYAHFLMRAGRLDESIAEFRRTLSLNPNAEPETRAQLASVLILRKRYDEAKAIIATLPDGRARNYSLSLLREAPGHAAESETALSRLERAPADTRDIVHYAEALTFHGRHDDAFGVLQARRVEVEGQYEARPSQFWALQEDLRVSYLLVPLHADPRWQALTTLPH